MRWRWAAGKNENSRALVFACAENKIVLFFGQQKLHGSQTKHYIIVIALRVSIPLQQQQLGFWPGLKYKLYSSFTSTRLVDNDVFILFPSHPRLYNCPFLINIVCCTPQHQPNGNTRPCNFERPFEVSVPNDKKKDVFCDFPVGSWTYLVFFPRVIGKSKVHTFF